ncbi:MAG TPA: penicillin acylase family protein, partial [Anaerolinea sp.]|nr:penicillin acylase family protein [Anaerolinea sp.]
QIAGGKSETITVRYTRHGPILWDDVEAMDKFRADSGLELPAEYRLALRWTALEPSNTFPALWKIDKAQNWDEFRQGASLFDVPAQNFVYADVDGNIGYQMPGKIPVRAKGDGRTYVPGWTGEYEWTGMIPFEELPYAFNPPEGYIATANNAVVGANYPHLITTDWDYGFRAAPIVDMISSAPGPIDSAYIQQMQGDDRNLSLDFNLPVLQGIKWGDPQEAQALDMLAKWDGQERMDSPEAALYEAFWRNLLVMTFDDNLPEDQRPEGGSRWYEVVRNISAQPESTWWDDQKTPQKETRDDIYRAAFSAAVKEMRGRFGADRSRWNWGDLHTITFRNKTFGESGIGPIEALFNRGPFRTAGGESIVNATGWDIHDPYQVSWLPSMRMIVDLGDLNASLAIHTTGQSGHAYHPNYIDMADTWRNIQYQPMAWDAAAIQAGAQNHLRLLP